MWGLAGAWGCECASDMQMRDVVRVARYRLLQPFVLSTIGRLRPRGYSLGVAVGTDMVRLDVHPSLLTTVESNYFQEL